MQCKLLTDCPEALEIISQWYLDEWGYISEVGTMEKSMNNTRKYLNADKVPLMMVGLEDGKAIGAAQLKFHEMPQYPEKEHWLGGVYVTKPHRGKGVAEKIILALIEQAKTLKVPTLYLQTESLDGGLYARMGWQPIEQVNNQGIEVLVMEKSL